MESGKTAGHGNGLPHTPTARQAKRAGPDLEAGPEASAERSEGTMEARQGRDAAGGSMRNAHDSATGHVSWPGTHGLQGSMHKLMRQSSGNRFGSDCRGLADPALPVRRSLRGAKHRAVGIARRTFPWRQAKRAAPRKGRVGITPSRQNAGWIPIPASTAMTSPAGSAHRARTAPTARWAGRTR